MFQLVKTIFLNMSLSRKIYFVLTTVAILYFITIIFSFILTIALFFTGLFVVKSILYKLLGKSKNPKIKTYHYQDGIEKEIREINPDSK